MARAVQIRRGRRHAGGALPYKDSPTRFLALTYVEVPSCRTRMCQDVRPW